MEKNLNQLDRFILGAIFGFNAGCLAFISHIKSIAQFNLLNEEKI